MKAIDFSCKHNVMLRDYNGNMLPMDEPYFEVRQLDDATWQIMSDGDFYYLLAGDEIAMCIDGGYGCGNAREFCQTLTDKPVKYIANTHDHFDHVANNSYFDVAFMSQETKDAILAGNVMPSFEGVQFPTDYNMQVVKTGDTIDLGGRVIEVFAFPDHALSSLSFLDRSHRMFFVGDELADWNKDLRRISVAEFAKHMEVMWSLQNDYDYCLSGTMIFHKTYVRSYLENARYILAGNQGIPRPALEPRRPVALGPELDSEGRIVYDRRRHRYHDSLRSAKRVAADINVKLFSEFAGSRIIYDKDKIY